MPEPIELAVVVIGHRAPASIVDAVRSVLAQDVALEIVVVNSGGGDVGRMLSDAGLDVRVIDVEERLLVGAARNRGIAATRAPFIAFLADDCLACPGWARFRLERHRAGNATVASAMVNGDPHSRLAWAAHLLLFMRRLPGLPEQETLRYGVSFDRRIFSEHGLFHEGKRIAEDTEFLSRLPPTSKPVWDGRIRTAHRNPTTLAWLIADQWRRGRRLGAYLRESAGHGPWRCFRIVKRDGRKLPGFLERGLDGVEREQARRAQALARLALLVKALGALWGALVGAKASQ